MKLAAPYVPMVKWWLTQPIEDDYASYRNANISSSVSSGSTLDLETSLMLKSATVQDLFSGYYLNIDQSAINRERSHSELSKRKLLSVRKRAWSSIRLNHSFYCHQPILIDTGVGKVSNLSIAANSKLTDETESASHIGHVRHKDITAGLLQLINESAVWYLLP